MSEELYKCEIVPRIFSSPDFAKRLGKRYPLRQFLAYHGYVKASISEKEMGEIASEYGCSIRRGGNP